MQSATPIYEALESPQGTIQRLEAYIRKLEPVVEAAIKWRHGFDAENAPRYPSIEAEDLDDNLRRELSDAVEAYEKGVTNGPQS